MVCMFVFKHTATKGHRCNEGDMRILNMACCRKTLSVSRHGMQAIKIWSALDNELVTVKMRITTFELYETQLCHRLSAMGKPYLKMTASQFCLYKSKTYLAWGD